MESVRLKDFISETLKAISLGVSEAQEASQQSGGIPIALYSVGGTPVSTGEQLVNFTVALQAETSTSSSATAGVGATLISVVTGKIELSGERTSVGQSVHTVQFSVPIHFNSRWPKQDE